MKYLLSRSKVTAFIHLIFLFGTLNATAQNIAINEFMSSNETSIIDEDGSYEDWIEIYNYGVTIVNLGGFGLSDQVDNPFKWVFPNRELAPNEYLIVWASDKNRTPASGELHTNFKIKSGGEAMVLTNASGTTLSESPAVTLAADKSYGRIPNGSGNWAFLEEPTPGASNANASNDEIQKIAINEIVSLNESVYADEDGDFVDWIEIYNYGDTVVDLNGFGLSDDNTLPYKWTFPSVSLQPGAFMLVFASGKDRANSGSELHTNFGIGAGGETLTLTNANGVLISGSPSVNLQVDTSYGRQPDGTGSWFYFDVPTPLVPNTESGNTVNLEPPRFSHSSGVYSSSIDIALSTDVQNATIIYTLDGSEPDINNLSGSIFTYKNEYANAVGSSTGPLLNENYISSEYSVPITLIDRSNDEDQLAVKNTRQSDLYIPPVPVRKGTVIKAKTYLNGKGSATKTMTYFVWEGGNPYNVPILSLSTFEGNLFGYNSGIYTSGVTFDNWRSDNPNVANTMNPIYHNYGQSGEDWERPVTVEFFDEQANPISSLNAGMRIHGNTSRNDIIKSLRLYGRNEYDTSNEFQMELFDEQIFDASVPYNNEFRRLMLRGNGSGGYIANDVTFNRLFQPIFNGVTRIKTAIHFFNGEYWGITGIRDRMDQHHFAKNFNLNSNNIAIIDCVSNCVVTEGSPQDEIDFRSLMDFIKQNDLSIEANYEYVISRFDIITYIDHLVLEIFSEGDSYETKYWRAIVKENDDYGDGKWRIISQDFESAMKSPINWLENFMESESNFPNKGILRHLVKNESFKNQFISRIADLLNTALLKERFDSVVDKVFSDVAPLLEEDGNRSIRERFYAITDRDRLEQWIIDRPNAFRNQILDEFNLNSVVSVNLDLSDPKAGYVQLNTVEINPTFPGVPEDPYPWNGLYFEGVPITLEAVEYPGYTFSHWSGSSNSTDKTISINPNDDVSLVANYNRNANYEHLAYFWLFDNQLENDTPLESINSTYSRYEVPATLNYTSSLEGYPFTPASDNWRKASMERKNSPTDINYIPFANDEIPYNENFMRGIQIKQPFQLGNRENKVELEVNTFNFSDLKLAFAIQSDGAAETVLIDYWNGSNWITNNITSSETISSSFERKEIDFTNVALANNNENFKIRLRFDGSAMAEDEGKSVVFNNISISGVEGTLSASNDALETNTPNLEVFPNPVQNQVNIVSDTLVERIQIFNLIGQLVYSSSINAYNTTIDLAQLKKGLYMMKLFSDGTPISRKIIKSN